MMDGQARNSLAALDATTGVATAWNPLANTSVSSVSALALSGGTVYAAGYFTSIDGHRAAVSPPSMRSRAQSPPGTRTAFERSQGGGRNLEVNALLVSGGSVYVGGSFTDIVDSRATTLPRSMRPRVPPRLGSERAVARCTQPIRRYLCAGGERGHGLRWRQLQHGRRTAAQQHRRNRCGDGCRDSLESGRRPSFVRCSGHRLGPDGERRNGLRRRLLHQHWRADAQLSRRAQCNNRSRHCLQPNPDGYIQALAASGGLVYAGGGHFSASPESAGGRATTSPLSTRPSGVATAWNPTRMAKSSP